VWHWHVLWSGSSTMWFNKKYRMSKWWKTKLDTTGRMYTVWCIDNTNWYIFSNILGGQSESATSYVVTKTTEGNHDDDFDVEKKTRPPKKRKTTTKPTTLATKLARNRVTLPVSELVENTDCTFQGNMPDPDNCQCNYLNRIFFIYKDFLLLAYYTCKEDVITRIVQISNYLMKIHEYVMIIEKFFVQIDQQMNVEMIHVKINFFIIINIKYFWFRYWSTKWLVCR